MSKVMKVLTNKWFILGVSLLNAVYTAYFCYFAYSVFFYDIEFTNKTKFAVIYAIFSFLIGLLLFYTRKSPLTAIFAMLNVVILFPTLLLDWGNWPLLIPAAVVTLFGFFCCKMNDTFKTIIGTVFLLMYIIGGVAFFLVMNVFRVSTVDTLIDSGVSPSGYFRYYVLDMKNNATGKTAVYVQPNKLDIEADFIRMDSTIKKLVKQANNPTTVTCKWSGDKLLVNGEEYFNESHFISFEGDESIYDFTSGNWTYTYFSVNYPLFDLINSMTETISEKLSEKNSEAETAETAVTAAKTSSAKTTPVNTVPDETVPE